MRKLIMWNLVSLDGFFEGANKWDLPFHEVAWGPDLERLSIEQTGAADMLLFGRVTYEGMAAHWPNATGTVADIMNRIPKVVFSRSIERADWTNARVARDAVAEVRRLRAEPGGDMLVFGSADLCASLIAHDLIDEFRICVVPVFQGQGTPLFREGPPKRLELRGTRTVDTGAVILTYGLAAPAA